MTKTTKRDDSKVRRMFLFSHTLDNLKVIEAMRKALNRKRYKMMIRGRGPDRALHNPHSYCREMPLKYADKFAVYVDEVRKCK